MCEKRGVDQRVAIDHSEFNFIYGGIGHRIHSFRHSAAHRNQFRLREKVAIFLVMKDGKLIPEKGDQSERGAKDGLASSRVKTAVNAELVLDGVVHRADAGDSLADLIAKTVSLAEKIGVAAGGLGQAKEAGGAAKDGCKGGAHSCDGADRPYLVEDEGHNDQREQDADEAIAGRGELRRSGEAREDHQVIGEGDLQPDVAEVTSSGDPGRQSRQEQE